MGNVLLTARWMQVWHIVAVQAACQDTVQLLSHVLDVAGVREDYRSTNYETKHDAYMKTPISLTFQERVLYADRSRYSGTR